MTSIAYVFLIIGGILVRAVTKGRSIKDIPGDIGDAFAAAVKGDGAAFSEALSRSGSELDAEQGSTGSVSAPSVVGAVDSGLLAEMHRIGEGKSYSQIKRLGPDSFDCSGLVYVAMKNLKMYNGVPFTTATFQLSLGNKIQEIDKKDARVGDILLWRRAVSGHIGVMSGKGRFYSALNTKSGVVDTNIYGTPKYFRYVGDTK